MDEQTIIQTFDIYRIFLGSNSTPLLLLEIAFRTAFMYSYTLFNIRIFKTHNVAQLTLADLIIVIALGTAVGDPMMYIHVPLIQAMLSITTIVLITKAVALLVERNSIIEQIIEGVEILVIKDGILLADNMNRANLSKEELFTKLRIQGIHNTGQVLFAYLETSGLISVIKATAPTQQESTLSNLENN